MKINDWSVVQTADAKGVAIKPMVAHADDYEVCVAVRDGKLEINIYKDGVFDALSEFKMKLKGE